MTVPLVRATAHLSKAFEQQGGFYAIAEQLDANYSADGAYQTNDRCQVCGERLVERRLNYFGPRCLVVEHVSPIHWVSTQVAERRADELSVTLSYTNISTEPQWVFAFAFLSDPNNISRSTAPGAYKDLLSKIRSRRGQAHPRSLNPRETYNFQFRTGSISTNFWYLLMEVNLMVDFCWNWYSLTYRAKQIETWLSSARYPQTLPPRLKD